MQESSKENSPSSGHFARQMERLAANWAGSMSDMDVVRTRTREFRKVYDDVGPVRFEAAITAVLRSHSTGFFPSLGEFMGYIPAAGEVHRSTCRRCTSTAGLIMGESIHPVSGKHYRAMRACKHEAEVEPDHWSDIA